MKNIILILIVGLFSLSVVAQTKSADDSIKVNVADDYANYTSAPGINHMTEVDLFQDRSYDCDRRHKRKRKDSYLKQEGKREATELRNSVVGLAFASATMALLKVLTIR